MAKSILELFVCTVMGFSGVGLCVAPVDAQAKCIKECDPEVSKPCGKTCISKELDCHKPTTRACYGKAGKSTKKVYTTPVYVESTESKQDESK